MKQTTGVQVQRQGTRWLLLILLLAVLLHAAFHLQHCKFQGLSTH